jgi:hypothetical protein
LAVVDQSVAAAGMTALCEGAAARTGAAEQRPPISIAPRATTAAPTVKDSPTRCPNLQVREHKNELYGIVEPFRQIPKKLSPVSEIRCD